MTTAPGTENTGRGRFRFHGQRSLAHSAAGAGIDYGEAQFAQVVLVPVAVVAATNGALVDIELYVIGASLGERCRGAGRQSYRTTAPPGSAGTLRQRSAVVRPYLCRRRRVGRSQRAGRE